MALKRVKYIREDGPPQVDVMGLGVVKRGESIELPPDAAENLVTTRPKHFAFDNGGGAEKKPAKTGAK